MDRQELIEYLQHNFTQMILTRYKDANISTKITGVDDYSEFIYAFIFYLDDYTLALILNSQPNATIVGKAKIWLRYKIPVDIPEGISMIDHVNMSAWMPELNFKPAIEVDEEYAPRYSVAEEEEEDEMAESLWDV